MSKSVFISHATEDEALARKLVDLIEDGIGVPEKEIFCSSLKGYGIPAGQNFITYIKDQLVEPKVVVLVLTPAYFESKFCLSELGAAWIKSHKIFPILVPPLQHKDVKDVLLGTQVANIDDDIEYNELRGSLTKAITFKAKSQTKWDRKRREFLTAIKPILKKVPGPSLISASELKVTCDELTEAKQKLDALKNENRNLKSQLSETEALKIKNQRIDDAICALHELHARINGVVAIRKDRKHVWDAYTDAWDGRTDLKKAYAVAQPYHPSRLSDAPNEFSKHLNELKEIVKKGSDADAESFKSKVDELVKSTEKELNAARG